MDQSTQKLKSYDIEDDKYKNVINTSLGKFIPQYCGDKRFALILDSTHERTGKMLSENGFICVVSPEIDKNKLHKKYSISVEMDYDSAVNIFVNVGVKHSFIFPDYDNKSIPSIIKSKITEKLLAIANPNGAMIAFTASQRCGGGRNHKRCIGHLKSHVLSAGKKMGMFTKFISNISSKGIRNKRGSPMDTIIFHVRKTN